MRSVWNSTRNYNGGSRLASPTHMSVVVGTVTDLLHLTRKVLTILRKREVDACVLLCRPRAEAARATDSAGERGRSLGCDSGGRQAPPTAEEQQRRS